MPTYAYTALDEDGSKVKGKQKSPTATRVYTTLIDRDLKPITVKERKSVLKFEITKKKVKRKELMHFSRQLAVFIKAGISVLEALEIVNEEVDDKLLRKALVEMLESLKAGDTFASAAAQHPEVFPAFYIGVLRAAELTGNLDDALAQLADYVERDLEARRKISSALVYPAIVGVMSLVTVLVLTIFVLPRFVEFFESLNAELPIQTRMLLNTAAFLTAWGWLVGLVLLTLVVLTVAYTRTEGGRARMDRIVLKLPLAGDMIHHAILERFCRVLASMVKAGVPLPEAMTLTADGTNNALYRKGLNEAREAMIRGEGLSAPLARTKLFPSAARQMIRVGEETGTLDRQLETAAQYYDAELEYKIKRFTNTFEPAMIIVMGLVVGFVAVALVSAMYGIFNQVDV
ncbi:MAG TPA: type II secretion system F family protein [Acidimicrobiales bacterium]|nr:type II secretion system F family protein [Acidimicrobiales bacterium]